MLLLLLNNIMSKNKHDTQLASDQMIVAELSNCSRCNESHKNITFSLMSNPVDDFIYWAPCPANGHPILMKYTIE